MKNVIIITALFIAAIIRADAQNTASNIRVQAQSDLIIAYYDLAERSNVEAYVSFDNGEIWQGPIQHSSGSVGNGVQPGRDKIIIWNSIDEIGSVESNTLVRVIATRVGSVKSPDVTAFIDKVIPGVSLNPQVAEALVEPEPPPPVAPVVATPTVAPTPPPRQTSSGSGGWVVIIGSFPTITQAERYVRQMEAEGLNCEIIDAGQQRFRVSAGRFSSLAQANSLAEELKPSRNGQVWVTSDN